MPKARKRKTPVTSIDATHSSSSTPQSSRTLIRQFHVLLKRKAQLQNRHHDSENAKTTSDIDREIEELGGLSAYQRMSSIGQGNDRGGGSEKVLITWLKEDGVVQNCKKDGNKLKFVCNTSVSSYQLIRVSAGYLKSEHSNPIITDPVRG